MVKEERFEANHEPTNEKRLQMKTLLMFYEVEAREAKEKERIRKSKMTLENFPESQEPQTINARDKAAEKISEMTMVKEASEKKKKSTYQCSRIIKASPLQDL